MSVHVYFQVLIFAALLAIFSKMYFNRFFYIFFTIYQLALNLICKYIFLVYMFMYIVKACLPMRSLEVTKNGISGCGC